MQKDMLQKDTMQGGEFIKASRLFRLFFDCCRKYIVVLLYKKA